MLLFERNALLHVLLHVLLRRLQVLPKLIALTEEPLLVLHSKPFQMLLHALLILFALASLLG